MGRTEGITERDERREKNKTKQDFCKHLGAEHRDGLKEASSSPPPNQTVITFITPIN